MKKLNLEMLRLTSADVLERSQMKKITGGYRAGGSSMVLCTCSVNGRSYGVTCSTDLAYNGTNLCCGVHYPGAHQIC
jgi:natural product precursor